MTEEVLRVNITTNEYVAAQETYPALRVSLKKPPVSAEYVTHNGEIVTEKGEPVFVLIEE